jgi:tRNA threonylcarbamoyl adenosine modification protein YeaZ
MLILAFDTATDVATCALVDGATVLAESVGTARTLLCEVDSVVERAGVDRDAIEALAVGLGPGSFTGARVGLALARGLSLALGIPAAGVSTLDALAHGAAGGRAVIDARRGEVFVAGPLACAPEAVRDLLGATLVGNGAIRYRATLEAAGATVPPDDDPRHVPHARNHAALAVGFAAADQLQPIYVRAPDAKAAA